MRCSPFAALLLGIAACQSSRELPEGRAERLVHDDYAAFRPVVIAVLPVDAPTRDLRLGIRKETYERLFDKQYSPLALTTVDAHVASDGSFDAESLEWDAKLETSISSWKAVAGTQYFAADGVAVLEHRTGETLWKVTFSSHTFHVPSRAGEIDETHAARAIARFLVERLPDRPPLPRE